MIHRAQQLACLLTSILLLAACSALSPPELDPASLPPPQNITAIPAASSLPDPDSILSLPPEFKALLDREMAGISSKRRRADRLLSLLFEEEELNIGYEFGTTMTPAEVLEAGMSNCMSVSALVVAAARHIGINARFQEVRTSRNWSRVGEVYFLNRHINVRLLGLNSRYDYEVDLLPYPGRVSYNASMVNDRIAYAHFYNNLAGEALARGESGLAYAYFTKSLSITPRLSFIWANLGTLYMMQEDHPTAELVLEQALELNRRDYVATNNMAHLYHLTGRSEAAARYDARAENIRRDNPYYLATLAEEHLEKQDLDEARELLEEALKKEQEDYVLHLLAARIYLALGDGDKAGEHLALIEQAEQQDISMEDAKLISHLKQQLELV